MIKFANVSLDLFETADPNDHSLTNRSFVNLYMYINQIINTGTYLSNCLLIIMSAVKTGHVLLRSICR